MLIREAKLQGIIRNLFKAFLWEFEKGPFRIGTDPTEATFGRIGPSLYRTHQKGRRQPNPHDDLEDL